MSEMSVPYIFSATAFGDCLITLALVEDAVAQGAALSVIGTGLTARVSKLLNHPLPVNVVFPTLPAFYDLRVRGVWHGINDLISVRRALRQAVPPTSRLGFERRDVRNQLLVPRRVEAVWANATGRTYFDRQQLVNELTGTKTRCPACMKVKHKVQTVLLNPGARQAFRCFDTATMESLLVEGRRRGWTQIIVDATGAYAQYAGHVDQYYLKPDLKDAVALLKSADYYIGPDSFFMHLACYFKVPFLAVTPTEKWSSFVPVGMDELENRLTFSEVSSAHMLSKKLDFLGA